MNLRCLIAGFLLFAAGLQAQHLSGKYNSDYKIYETADRTYTCSFFRDGLALLYKDGFLGLIDSFGNILLKPQFNQILDFEKGIAIVRLNKQSGIIDRKGNIILHPDSVQLQSFNTGFANFKDNKSGLYGIISDSGKIITSAKYKVLQQMREERAAFLRNNSFGLLTEDGREIIWDNFFETENHPELDISYGFYHRGVGLQLFNFHNGIAPFFIQKGDKILLGFFDKEAKTVIPPIYEDLENFQRFDTAILAPVKFKGKWGLIDIKGKEVLAFKYESPEELRRIRAANQSKGQIQPQPVKGHSDILTVKEAEIYPLFGNFYITSKNGKWGLIDNNGHPQTKFRYDAIIALDSNTAVLSWYEDSYSLNTGIPRYSYLGSYHYMDSLGKISKRERRFSKTIEGIADDHNNKFVISKGPAYFAPGTIHRYYKTKIKLSGPEAEHDLEETIFGSLKIVSFDTRNHEKNYNLGTLIHQNIEYKKGVIDGSGKLIIPAEYEQIISTDKPLLIVSKSVKNDFGLYKNTQKLQWGVIDLTGKTVIPLEYNCIEDFNSAFFVRKEIAAYDPSNDKYEDAIFDLSGNPLIPFSPNSHNDIYYSDWFNSRIFINKKQ
jgi:hypothetical protein